MSDKYREVWERLSRVDVSDHVEKKNGLNYISWSWAWSMMCQHYPGTGYTFEETENSGGTVTVHCKVEVVPGVFRYMWLPVMDHRNKAIKDPDACAINKTRMRCLVKTLGMFGLGLNVYAGEDLPVGAAQEKEEEKKEKAQILQGLRECKEYFGDEVWDYVSEDLVRSSDLADRRSALETLQNVMQMREGK